MLPSTESKPLADWLARIEAIHPVGWDLGLDRVATVGERLDVLKPADQVILVAGTNGKGSTCEYLGRLAGAAGLSYGVSTSPHFFSFAERICIDGKPVADATIVAAFEQIEAARGEVTLTYFEFATLASLLVFKQSGLDVAVLEIGLGGRLDAMNIVEPDLCVITGISMDHESWLGDTREKIGAEKAGIMRTGVTCIITDEDPPASVLVHAEQLSAPVQRLGKEFQLAGVTTRLPAASYAGALAGAGALGWSVDPEDAEEVARSATLMGRMSEFEVPGGVKLVLDVGHNPAAAEYLGARLPVEGVVQAVFGVYADKDIAGVVQPLCDRINNWHLAPLQEARGAEVAAILDELPVSARGKAETYGNIAAALEAAIAKAGPGDTIVAFGSFVVVADAFRYLSEHYPTDT